ncbi:family 4 glycosyl hydrolase [Rhizobium miluonense]|uniref:6-phospho-beta-glucosidase n=1 Tax=Rhizobium miluonense TaxID=411945 RepID=A0A1C3V732_9HYPH|nr:glycoside hydrolase [Rhizobium miluonense]SCB23533.1 6-phospho-beta-glucosidase [Rhizobium miluonense]
MASIKVAYLGGGSTRAVGTVASFIQKGDQFAGSEIVLIDLNDDSLALVQRLGTRMAFHAGVDIKITATTDRREGLRDCQALLSSFRPGGFEARALDERIPLKHGVIGQETQGPGGFFMALRSIAVMKEVAAEMAEVCPKAIIFNYTNPVNIVSQALTSFTDIPTISFCEGPIVFPQRLARAASLDPEKLHVEMSGVNHNCWSTKHIHDGEDFITKLRFALANSDLKMTEDDRRLLSLAVRMESVPSSYFLYYYFKDEILRHLQAAPKTRAEEIMGLAPGYWQHYREQVEASPPTLDPARSRGGIHELELAIDAMAAYFNDERAVLPVNLPNTDGAVPGFVSELVVEMPAIVDGSGFKPIPQARLPHQTVGLVHALAEYQILTAHAAWKGDVNDGIRALTANPLVPSLPVAEALYTEMAYAHAKYLPERLVP